MELSEQQVREQVEALEDYASRGGAVSRWLDSKDFAPEDRRRILAAYYDAVTEPPA